MNKKRILLFSFILLSLVQLAVPASMIIRYEATLKYGTQYRFKTAPVDPYDAFRGRYVALNIQENRAKVPPGVILRHNQEVYALLEKDENGFAKIKEISLTKPEAGDFVKASVNGLPDQSKRVNLFFSFDRYYMEEHLAPEAERAYQEFSFSGKNRANPAYITVRTLSGFSVLEELYIDNKPVHEYLADKLD